MLWGMSRLLSRSRVMHSACKEASFTSFHPEIDTCRLYLLNLPNVDLYIQCILRIIFTTIFY